MTSNSEEYVFLDLERLRAATVCESRSDSMCVDGGAIVSARKYTKRAFDVSRALRDFGVTGEFRLVPVAGKEYVIFKGYPGLRRYWRGVRMLTDKDKSVHFATGRLGFLNRLKLGATTTIVFACSRSVIDAALGVIPVESVLPHMLVDVGKATIGAVLASAATTLAVETIIAAGVTTVAATVAAGVVIGIAVGVALDWADERWGISESLIEAMERAARESADWWSDLERRYAEFEHGLMRWSLCQVPMDNSTCDW